MPVINQSPYKMYTPDLLDPTMNEVGIQGDMTGG